jgi:hypothetical protein
VRRRLAIVGVSLAVLLGVSAPVMANSTSGGPHPKVSTLCINIRVINMGPCLL